MFPFTGFFSIFTVVVIVSLVLNIFTNIFTSFRKHMEKKNQDLIKEKESLQSVEQEYREMVIDPVCNKKIPKDDVYIAVIDDKRHYFCSWECRQKFIADRKKKLDDDKSRFDTLLNKNPDLYTG